MELVEKSLKYRLWRESLDREGIQVQSVRELHTIRKSNGQVLFTLLGLEAVDPDGIPLMPCVLLRGHFVSVMIILEELHTGEEFLLLVRQRRVGSGMVFYEHPAGMCDEESDPYVVAIHEVSEETGLTINRNQLHLLNRELLFSSPGLMDEGGYFFYCRLRMDRKSIELLGNRKTGDTGEHERIHTFVCPLKEAVRYMRNTNSLINWYLYLESIKTE